MAADWLLKKDDPIKTISKDGFIDKSILGILGILGRIKKLGTFSNKKIYKINGTLKLLFTLINIVFLSLSRSFIFVSIYDLAVIISLFLLEKDDRKSIAVISSIIPLLTVFMLIPSFIYGNIHNSILIIMKITGTILSVNILSYTTKWNYITKSLKFLFIPDLFIWIMDITIKYIVILGEHSINLLYALKLRSVGKNDKKYNNLSVIIGNLFLSSKDMGEEMFAAMACRGFTGEYTSISKLKFDKIDALYTVLNLLVPILCIWLNINKGGIL
ncbi:MAG: energy-coupling factor transporter transmembrane component T family protein [Solirubrobacterales bacterium]